MSKIKFYKGNKSSLPSTAKTEGDIYFCEDTTEIYVAKQDLSLKRYSDMIVLDSEAEKDAMLTPLSNKFYYVKSSKLLYFHDGNDFQNISGGSTTPTSETYINSNPTVNAIGNIQSGATFSTPQTMQEMFDFLFYYTPPIISFYASQSQGYYEIGTSLSNLTLTNNITKKSNKIIKIEYYKNNMLLNTNNFPNSNGGVDSFIDTSTITATTNYYSKIYDEKSSVISSSLQYNFVYPCYIGSVDNTSPIESQIKAMTKRLVNKSNQSFDYTISTKYFCFAYPANWGNITKIIDPNNFELLSTFNIINMNFTMLDNKSIPYIIYISSVPTTQSSFTVTYNF